MRPCFFEDIRSLVFCLETFEQNQALVPGPGALEQKNYNGIITFAQALKTYRRQLGVLPGAPPNQPIPELRELMACLREARTHQETLGFLEAELFTGPDGYVTLRDNGLGIDIRANICHLVTDHLFRSYDLGSHLPGGSNHTGAGRVSFWPPHMSHHDVYTLVEDAIFNYLASCPQAQGIAQIPHASLNHPGICIRCTHPDGGVFECRMILQGVKMLHRPVYHLTAFYPILGSGVIRATRANLNTIAYQLPPHLR